jgi:putative transposase
MIQGLAEEYPVRLLCRVLDVNPGSYYYVPQGRDDLGLLSRMEGVLLRFPTYGYRRVTAQLRREGCLVNHKRVRRVMRENDLLAVVRRRPRTTNSRHSYGRFPNLVQDLTITQPDQVWCSDITYIRLQQDFVYLAILLDIFTRGLRGWNLGHRLNTDLVLTALERALTQGTPQIHHSDQGVQYAAGDYVERLQGLDVQISMAAKGKASQNPHAERVIRMIKEEEVYLADYVDFADAHASIRHFIEEVYQTKRIHSALEYLTPAEFEAAYWAEKGLGLPMILGHRLTGEQLSSQLPAPRPSCSQIPP